MKKVIHYAIAALCVVNSLSAEVLSGAWEQLEKQSTTSADTIPVTCDSISDTTRTLLSKLTENHSATMAMYDSFLQLMKKGYPNSISKGDIECISSAIEFAAYHHREQRRKNPEQEPYIIHPIGVAQILWSEGRVRNADVLIAAILHDTIEDTGATYEMILEQFGEPIASIVAEVTDDKSLPKAERKQKQIDNAPHKSPEAKLVKLADKLYNLRDLHKAPPSDWDQERVDLYFAWAEKVVVGLSGVNSSLEYELHIVFNMHQNRCQN